MLLTPTTELEAVNELLAVIGESPVSTLSNDGFVDAVIAKDVLRKVSREVQSRGWSFNTLKNYPLAVDGSGQINLPANTLQYDQSTKHDWQFDTIQRGTRVFDKKTFSYIFTDGLEATLVQFIDFEELPEPARQYITIRAARIFQTRMMGSETISGLTQEEEGRALVELTSHDGDVNDYTMLSGHYDVGNIIDR
jgi:hypothetical protein